MNKYSELYNALPDDVRELCKMEGIETEINLMKVERGRLKRRYDTSVKEINEKIKFLERELR